MVFDGSEGMRRWRITEQEGCVDVPAKRVMGKIKKPARTLLTAIQAGGVGLLFLLDEKTQNDYRPSGRLPSRCRRPVAGRSARDEPP